MATFDKLDWHPNKDDTVFKTVIKSFNKFRSNLNENANDLPLDKLDFQEKLHEVNIYCKYHPLNYVESYWNVDVRKKNEWWLSEADIIFLENYGFIIKSN